MPSRSTDSAKAGTLAGLAERARRCRGRGLGEQDTKATLIEPLLEALGWSVRDHEEVCREYRAAGTDNPVDYALMIDRRPVLLVEAKALGENLADRRRVGQAIGYAAVSGVRWCVLTDGDEYRLYNATLERDADDKLFDLFRLSELPLADLPVRLAPISRAGLRDRLIDAHWRTCRADREVSRLLETMLREGEPGLVRSLRKRLHGIEAEDIRGALTRLHVQLGPRPALMQQPAPAAGTASPGSVLAALITAGVIAAPLRLEGRYGDKAVEARLLSDGRVEYHGVLYLSCSAAGAAALSEMVGRPRTANGWTFWRYTDANGAMRSLADARETFTRGRPGKGYQGTPNGAGRRGA